MTNVVSSLAPQPSSKTDANFTSALPTLLWKDGHCGQGSHCITCTLIGVQCALFTNPALFQFMVSVSIIVIYFALFCE
jgi:hypothetical protein